MRRREFIAGLGAAAWPVVTRAQQPAPPVVGFLSGYAARPSAPYVAAFNRGLGEAGFVAGRNVTVEFRWAEYHYQRLPALAADLVHRNVAVIFAIGAVNTTLAAKAATKTIPIVFTLGSDPVELGIVASLNRPGGNLTGMTVLATKLVPKRLEILRELVPGVATIGLLTNPNNPNSAGSVQELQAVAKAGGITLEIFPITSETDFETAFAAFDRLKVGAFLNTSDAVFTTRYERMINLAARYRLPTVYNLREHTDAGGLMNYGFEIADAVRQAANYVGLFSRAKSPPTCRCRSPRRPSL
jgi:putative tryptophan/tyrosine transport system substrate-binding protein